MVIKELFKTARSITIELADGGIFETKEPYQLRINNQSYGFTQTVVSSLYGLKPDQEYFLECVSENGMVLGTLYFKTEYEFVTLNVRSFGAKGNGLQDDTAFIQAAIMSCPKHGRVYIPRGTYKISGIFLKSHLRIEFAKGAYIVADQERFHHPILPGLIESYDEQQEYNLGSWEGNPLPMFAGIITGIDVEDIVLYGEGIIDGCGSMENWWQEPKKMRGAFRPRMLFLNRCNHVMVQGLTFQNSPSWTLHPYFSNQLGFYNVKIHNPSDSPNTDGLNPESSKDIVIKGVKFSLGDDCIAVKAGKIYMGRKYKVSSENILVSQCLMEHGHGAVTIGSEMAGGVKKLLVENCLFRHTDRGLRVKTRRGRGKDAVLDEIVFRNIRMDHVKTPFVVNSFYFCDPDGKTDYVQKRVALPVDERTPHIKKLSFENITCTNCHVSAGFFYGLPEQKIESLELKDITVSFADKAVSGLPAMLEGIEECSKQGFDICNVKTLICQNIIVKGYQGEEFRLQEIEHIEHL